MVIVESIAVAALGWVASPLVGKLLNEGFKSLGIDAEEKLQELSDTVLPVLKSVIEKAEGSEHRKKVENWLQRLKDAYDDAEDALDLLNYWRLEREAANRVRPFRVPKPPKWIMPILKGCRDIISLRKIKLRRKLNKLEKIAREALKLRDLLGAQPDQTTAVPDSRRTISVPPLKVFGRDKDRDEIIRRLKMKPTAIRESGTSSIPTIAIHEPGSSSIPTIAIHELGSSSIPTIAIHEPGSSSMPTIAIHEPGSSSMHIIAIREPESSGIPIIAIVGRPGLGKTTLAQYVFKKLRSELGDGHFDPIMWVSASRNFNTSEIMKKIIRQASIASEPPDPVNLDDLPRMVHTLLRNLDTIAVGNLDDDEDLQQKMNKMLNAKKFLLVIDDVWCGEDCKINWKTLFTCLSNCGLPGSKILVTSQTKDTRRKIVAAKCATLEYIHDLKELEENHFLDLFIHHALPSEKMDSSLRKDLVEKCKTIAKKLNKDPTAAKIVGETIALELDDLLRSRPQGDCRTYLRTIAEKDWSDDKTKALMWSYRHLPAHLQRCFSYCSMYRRGYMFKDLELVQLWMAQGFIKPDDQKERMEDVGSQYLKELVSRFYIQHHNFFSYYTLHELLYDLAEKVTRNEFLRFEGNHNGEIPPTIRHLCIPADKLNEKKEEICKLKKLRTLIVAKGKSITLEENVATDIFNSLKKLRVLVLELHIENLAEFIGEMKHLRVLQVFGTSKFVLPESVCTFYQLQVLKVHNASSLPKHLNNLVNLRYLQPSDIADIGKFTSLQGLEYFQVRKEKGYELEQLQNLNELRGRLHIDNLENVESKNSAIAANLQKKKYLDELKLVWHDSEDNVNSSLDVEILKGLQLPPNLTSLHLDGYRGQLWPSWPESQTSYIQELVLRQCKLLEKIPPMDQLYPSCRSLELWHLSKLKALYTLPPELQKIKILGSPFLTFASNEDLQMSPDEKGSIIEVMRKSLRKGLQHKYKDSLVKDEKKMMNFIAAVNDSNNEASSAEHNKNVTVRKRWLEMHKRKMELIYNIQNEAKLLLPSTLTELYLKGCNITDRALSACLQTLTSLRRLSLGKIKTITCLPSEDVLGKMKALKTLQIWDCWALTSLGGIRSLPCLTELFLFGCPCLEIISFTSCADVDSILENAASLRFGDLPSLRSLSISLCPGLISVNLQKLHSLVLLHLRICSNLQEVRNLPSSLKRLEISRCRTLERSIKIDPCSRVRMLDGIRVNSFCPAWPLYGRTERRKKAYRHFDRFLFRFEKVYGCIHFYTPLFTSI